MSDLSYETASYVLDKIMDEVNGDSISDFLSWRDVDEKDFDDTVEYLYAAIEKLKDES